MKLYVYDHCPYCTKARMIFGYTQTPFELITLLNDDIKTPTDLIGAKMVPILEEKGFKPLPESLDIIDAINDKQKPSFLAPFVKSEKLNTWIQEARNYVYQLAMPRWVKSDLEEFKTQSAIDYFTKKKEDYIGPFKEHLENSENLISNANEHLKSLESFIHEIIEQKESLNHINLYATLRCLTVVKGLVFPKNTLAFMRDQEEKSKVPFHTPI